MDRLLDLQVVDVCQIGVQVADVGQLTEVYLAICHEDGLILIGVDVARRACALLVLNGECAEDDEERYDDTGTERQKPVAVWKHLFLFGLY